jgi:RND family efflux transporter MFP subunit
MMVMPRLLTAFLLAISTALAACGSAEQSESGRPSAAAGERLAIRPMEIADTKVVSATVRTRDMAEARARIGGTVAVIAVKEGDVVRRGQLIARVVDQRLTYEAGAAAAQVSAAAAEAARAQAELSRTEYLYRNGVYAKARLEQVEAAAKAAQGGLAAARAQHSASVEVGSQGAVLAPADGRVLAADVPAGSVVSPGQSLATITAGPPVLRLEIPEAEARNLKVGARVFVYPEDLPRVQDAVIAQIYPAVEGGRVVADATAPGLRADLVGSRVRVRIEVGRRQALTLPARFVSRRYGIDYATIIGRDGSASDVAVQLAPTAEPGRVEVLSGLMAGDTVVAPSAAR